MNVIMMCIKVSHTGHRGYSFQKLFLNEEVALKYLTENYDGFVEKTEELKKEYPWNDDINRTFYHEKPQFDSDGDWDYPIESTIEFINEEVLS